MKRGRMRWVLRCWSHCGGLSWVLLLLAHCVAAQVPDNRCYLENGGSTESFFVSEDVPVGTVIGTLRIHGDPSDRGNVLLRLKETDSPVQIHPGSKNLTLTRRLDKEGLDGPASVYVNVICDRKRTSDPGFVIPVNIRVTDANDNAPVFVNSPYVLNISEVTVVGTRVLQGVKAVDADQLGPYSTVQYSVLPGPHSDYFVFINGLEGTLVLRKALDYETLTNFSVGLRAQDQGSPARFSDTVLYVNVIDADDQNPRFFDDRYRALIPEDPIKSARLHILPRAIGAYDQDIGINSPVYFTFNSAGSDYRFFDIDRSTGHVTIKKTIPDEELLQPATLVVRATQYDNPDRYALATLSVSRAGTYTQDLQFLQRSYLASVLENVHLNSVLLTVVTNKPRDKRVRFYLDDTRGRFSITSGGDILLRKLLDFETEQLFSFLVHVTDGRLNDSARVNISVLNVNDWDPRFRYPQYEFFVSDLSVSAGDVVGKVEAADGDRGDQISLELRGPFSKVFGVRENGEIFIKDLSLLNSSTAHMVAVARDSGVPPRQASVPVIVHFPEAVVKSASSWAPGGSSFLLMVIFGALLGVLGLVIVLLIIYIYKHKKPKLNRTEADSPPITTKMANYMTNGISHEKLTPGVTQNGNSPSKIENPIFGSTQDLTSTMPQYTATVKSIMAGSSRGNYLRNGTERQTNSSRPGRLNNPLAQTRQVGPAPPIPPASQLDHRTPTPVESTPTPIVLPSSSTTDGASKAVNKVSWPKGSIPRRVKKLSWDDDPQKKTELDPEVSVTPLPGQDEHSDQMNLTVYF